MTQLATLSTNPFGTSITAEDIVDTLSFFDTWEDRYRYIIDLGKELPPMDEQLKTEDRLVRGCQSQVWMEAHIIDNTLWLEVDSDAFIVKGLLGIVLAAFNGKSAKDVLAFDIEAYLDTLGLLKHLSPTRGNGVKAMVNKIVAVAKDEMRGV